MECGIEEVYNRVLGELDKAQEKQSGSKKLQSTLEALKSIKSSKKYSSGGKAGVFSKEATALNEKLSKLMLDKLDVNIQKDKKVVASLLEVPIRSKILDILDGKDVFVNKEELNKLLVKGAYDLDNNTILLPSEDSDLGPVVQEIIDKELENLESIVGKDKIEEVKKATKGEVDKVITRLVRDTSKEMKRITSGEDTAQTVLHELGHALIQSYIENNPNGEDVLQLDALYLRLKEQIMENSQHLREVDTYWQTDLEEFMSEMMSNPTLIKELASMPAKGGGNILTRLVKAVLKMVGVESDTMYDVMMLGMIDIVKKGKGEDVAKVLDDHRVEMSKEYTSSLSEDKAKSNTTNDIIKQAKELAKECK